MMTLTAREQPFAGKTLTIPYDGSSTLSTGRKLGDASAPP
jgi:hypothetical protein